ncbi:DUF2849 domain-containing protein [Pacificibacter marinus]|uniref:Sulfite reductase n=1 Tax=Pacificibacter marinus TaxID=658057 RepID=A0A1Y5SWV1_9RHOB|nr:DUF2849 domain-containing protein [Pacificibacter marinus]SEK86481.1 Protein of unknown function [Pacificibacter marinus]SLN50332.1 hypothetical protein PAM7971_02489 [Pacificibacter marinus]
MARPFTPKIVTANALLEGDVIYLSPQDTWVRDLCDAALFSQQDQAEERLAFASKDGFVVGAYLVDAVAGENGPEPVHFREDFRRTGPSNHNHGKQAEL